MIAISFFRALYRFGLRMLNRIAPGGLFARSLLIIILPMLLLQIVVAYVFMERHWTAATMRLSSAFANDVVALVNAYDEITPREEAKRFMQANARILSMSRLRFLPEQDLPPPLPRPMFEQLDDALEEELSTRLKRPFWMDVAPESGTPELRILLDGEVLSISFRRSAAAVSNGHIFLVWMGVSSLVLILIAVLFLANQIRPILRLAEVAEAFGKGREMAFKPRGATEVRQAGLAFIEMKRRVARTIEQRTAMLNGVSHDLRTVLTRFRLSLAFLEEGPEVEALKRDVDEMNKMLEAYLDFARGDTGEQAAPTDLNAMLSAVRDDVLRAGQRADFSIYGDPNAMVRPLAFKRLMANLVNNAARHADKIDIRADHEGRWLLITVDDDGPGIPPDKRDLAFRPFQRLDEARNLDETGTGLGLAIARDIARNHGGDITLTESPLGGLRAVVRVPA
jgi:two-component system, OmpR family, osmolarity sensor histidine kinase EnvZ